MNRRRHGFIGRIFGGLQDFFTEAWSWFLWPFYLLGDGFAALFGRNSVLRRRPWWETLVDAALWIPSWIGVFLVWLYHAILRWPQYMRLRDLASGLPALIAAIAAVVIVFVLEKRETDLVTAYGTRTLELHQAANAETDEKNRLNTLKLAQFYARALLKLKPDELMNRYHVGYLYHELGDHARARGIMDSMARRDLPGFAPAHLWQGDLLLSGPLDAKVMGDAAAHYQYALQTYDQKEEVHRRLGDLYYLRYRRYDERTADPFMPKHRFLILADEHFSQVQEKTLDSRALLTLAEIRKLLGKNEQAELDVHRVIADLTFRLGKSPVDMESRLRLAQAHRMIREFDAAATVLVIGKNQRPDPRYDEELALTFYYWSTDIRQRNPRALAPQFAALQKGYLSSPTNSYVAYRYFQALTSESKEEAQFARDSLQEALDAKAPGAMAAFLLGFDHRRRSIPQRADDYFRMVKTAKPDATPAVMAGMMFAVLNGHVKSLNQAAIEQLYDTCVLVWPNDPDILMVKALRLLRKKDYPAAATELEKALKLRERDARLHEMLSATYKELGDVKKAQQHRDKADEYRETTTPFGL